jgi:geranylgeranyl diphosphate synthase type II
VSTAIFLDETLLCQALTLALARVPHPSLKQAMHYALFPGGKRLRPRLLLAVCQALGGNATEALPAAVAVELLHNYSLIHDDLPCMDNDTLRRGRPTLHVAFGEAMAVLAGDALLSLAFEVLATAPALSEPRRLAMLAHLARLGGVAGMLSGQVADLALEAATARPATNTSPQAPQASPLDQATLLAIHRDKTAALFEFCAWAGACAASPQEEAGLSAWAAWGQELGLLFQQVDDWYDHPQPDGKPSLITLLGPQAARDEIHTRGQALAQQLAALQAAAPATAIQADGPQAAWAWLKQCIDDLGTLPPQECGRASPGPGCL